MNTQIFNENNFLNDVKSKIKSKEQFQNYVEKLEKEKNLLMEKMLNGEDVKDQDLLIKIQHVNKKIEILETKKESILKNFKSDSSNNNFFNKPVISLFNADEELIDDKIEKLKSFIDRVKNTIIKNDDPSDILDNNIIDNLKEAKEKLLNSIIDQITISLSNSYLKTLKEYPNFIERMSQYGYNFYDEDQLKNTLNKIVKDLTEILRFATQIDTILFTSNPYINFAFDIMSEKNINSNIIEKYKDKAEEIKSSFEYKHSMSSLEKNFEYFRLLLFKYCENAKEYIFNELDMELFIAIYDSKKNEGIE